MPNDSSVPTRVVRLGSVKIGSLIRVDRDGRTAYERIEFSRSHPTRGTRTITTVAGTVITQHADSDVEIVSA